MKQQQQQKPKQDFLKNGCPGLSNGKDQAATIWSLSVQVKLMHMINEAVQSTGQVWDHLIDGLVGHVLDIRLHMCC